LLVLFRCQKLPLLDCAKIKDERNEAVCDALQRNKPDIGLRNGIPRVFAIILAFLLMVCACFVMVVAMMLTMLASHAKPATTHTSTATDTIIPP